MTRVCIEGNIGSGKSTAIHGFSRLRPDVPVYPEQVEEWGELLGMFYDDPAQWALALQLRALLSFGPPAVCAAPCCVVERSPVSCRHVFAQMLFNEHKMSQAEWDVFKRYCDALGWAPDLVVYIETPPEVCYERMKRRARDSEAGVELQYIKRLDFQYETMLRYSSAPVVRLDGRLPPAELAARIADLVDGAVRDTAPCVAPARPAHA